MHLRRTVSILTAAVALAGGVGACGDEDVDRGVDKAKNKASEAGKDAEKAGKDIKKEVED